ncbi:hypothetical protein B0H10DRAFT_952934 [Mycena sp. CBHHK59/15]|nr:hypothetical protein B0H10DRAFT_49447 [Mycena sp. CBHHK59/15]KAJ6575831.1 hypothetical protein B0H10DRAFT_952934 [Mycena sp. CBHHK59/15]
MRQANGSVNMKGARAADGYGKTTAHCTTWSTPQSACGGDAAANCWRGTPANYLPGDPESQSMLFRCEMAFSIGGNIHTRQKALLHTISDK